METTIKYEERKIAYITDLDNTLCRSTPDIILRDHNIDPKEFWKEVSEQQVAERDSGVNLGPIYTAHFLHEIQVGRLKGLTIQNLQEAGKEIGSLLYPGLPDFFHELRKANPHHDIRYNIVSAGFKHLIEGSVLAPIADKIFGYTFIDDLVKEDQSIDQLMGAVSPSDKVEAIVRISYGKHLNESQKPRKFEFPLRDSIYVGDGFTDLPSFVFVRRYGGLAICVYDPNEPESFERAQAFRDDVDHIVPADYRKEGCLWKAVMTKIQRPPQILLPFSK
jgi:phosphoserine phosphatase